MKGFISLTLFSALLSLATANTSNKIHKFENKEYYIEPENKYNWFEADSACALKNMSLVTIASKEKSIKIHNLLKNVYKDMKIPNLYIGAHDLGKLRKFVWIATGQPFTYTNWDKNEPNNLNGNERCVHIGLYGKDLWNDIPCEYKFGFICEDCYFE